MDKVDLSKLSDEELIDYYNSNKIAVSSNHNMQMGLKIL